MKWTDLEIGDVLLWEGLEYYVIKIIDERQVLSFVLCGPTSLIDILDILPEYSNDIEQFGIKLTKVADAF